MAIRAAVWIASPAARNDELSKLGVRDRTRAVLKAFELKLI